MQNPFNTSIIKILYLPHNLESLFTIGSMHREIYNKYSLVNGLANDAFPVRPITNMYPLLHANNLLIPYCKN